MQHLDDYVVLILKQKWDIRTAKTRDAEYLTMVEEDLKSTWDTLNTAVASEGASNA